MTDRNMTGLTTRDYADAIQSRMAIRQNLLDTMEENPFAHADNAAKQKAVQALDVQLRELREQKIASEAGVNLDPIDARFDRLGDIVDNNADVAGELAMSLARNIDELTASLKAIDEKHAGHVQQAVRRLEDLIGDMSVRVSSVTDRLDGLERKVKAMRDTAPALPAKSLNGSGAHA